MTTATRPPFDPELAAALALVAEELPSTITPEMIEPMRSAVITPPIEEILAERTGVTHREEVIEGYEGAEITVSVFARADRDAPGEIAFDLVAPRGGRWTFGDPTTAPTVG